MRRLEDAELEAMLAMAKALGGAGEQLAKDVSSGLVEAEDKYGAHLIFHLPGYDRPPYKGQRDLPVEGRMQDVDGAELRVLLWEDQNHRVYELELLRLAEGEPIAPDWRTFEVLRPT
jgi:hypothetical protein